MIFQESRSPAELDVLRSLFPINSDYLEERQFSRLHKIVLGLEFQDLREELAACRGNINTTDSIGMTPLAWASRRGNQKAVQHLLEYGADPDIACHSGSTPLLYTALSGSAESLRLLVAAGADTAHTSAHGSNAAHMAARYQCSRTFWKALAATGVGLNERRPIDGAAPLSAATVYNNMTAAATLLDNGAIINILDYDGDSPLYTSIYSHSHDITQLLLTRGANYMASNNDGDSILHFTARYGGIRTVEVLSTAHLHGLDPDAINGGGKTALQISHDRKDKPEGFVSQMTELLLDIQTQNANIERSETEENTSCPTESNPAPSQTLPIRRNFPWTANFGWIKDIIIHPQTQF